MSYFECDACGATEYTDENPFVEVRTPRPSDPSDMCCILAGCAGCFGGIGGTVKTPEGWTEYIESVEAYRNGHLFLT